MRVLVLLLLLPCFCFGQNLVPNPSFEDTLACPWGLMTNLSTWKQTTAFGTSDCYNACVPEILSCFAQSSVPLNLNGTQPARTGDGYVGGYWGPYGGNNYREYVTAPLLDTLNGGTTYYAEAYVNLADCGGNTIGNDGFGILLTQGYPDTTGILNTNLPYVPQIDNPSGNMLNDFTNWVKVSGSFVAVAQHHQILHSG